MKACSLDLKELTAWTAEQTGFPPKVCHDCRPTDFAPDVARGSRVNVEYHPTKLGQDIIACVLESAVIHLDNEEDYELTVADVAHYLAKTPAQISSALFRLVEERMITLEGELGAGIAVSETSRVFPTERALRTMPAFAVLSSSSLAAELATLQTRHDEKVGTSQ